MRERPVTGRYQVAVHKVDSREGGLHAVVFQLVQAEDLLHGVFSVILAQQVLQHTVLIYRSSSCRLVGEVVIKAVDEGFES